MKRLIGVWLVLSCTSGGAADEDGSGSTSSGATSTGSTDGASEDDDDLPSPDLSGGTSTTSDDDDSTGAAMPCEPARPRDGFHVSVDGTPDGDGSEASPWDLATALAHPPAVAAGSTIWVHEGTYAAPIVSTLAGAVDAPISCEPSRASA